MRPPRATPVRTALVVLGAGLALQACGSDPAAAPTAAATSTAAEDSGAAAEDQATSGTPPADAGTTSEPAPSPSTTSTEAASPEGSAQAGAGAVTIADFDFAPDPLEVAVGDTVTWSNEDSTAHTATVADGGPDTGAIGGGSSASLTFDEAGTYDYVCQFHPGTMTGTIVVG